MNDLFFLRYALKVAQAAHEKGNLPFGCILVDADGAILEEGENTVVSSRDAIAHCEINLVHRMAGKYSPELLATCTVYASTEPCPMCAGALYWSGVGRVVYALDKHAYHEATGTTNPAYTFDISASALLQTGGRAVTVAGPLLEEEATLFYAGFKH